MFKLSAFSRHSRAFCLAAALACLHGCGSVPTSDPTKDDSNGVNTLNSTIEDPDWGTFELLATGQNSDTGKWDFVVRTSRSVTKNQLRFVWDFGSGPEGEGLQQSHTFTENGSYEVTVTAYGADNSVAFVLKLSIDVGVNSNRPPVAKITAEEFVAENELVFLFGGGSTDPDQDEITYQWAQVSGPSVQIQQSREASASFVSPLVDTDQELVFRLTVSDGELTNTNDAVIVVSGLLDPSEVPDEESVDTDGDGIADEHDECPNHPDQIVAGACGCGEEDRPDCPARVTCIASTSEWRNLNFPAQSGSFEIQFSATPKSNNMDAIVGLSSAMATRFSASAVLIRFNPAGEIDVRNGGAYEADTALPYSAEVQYNFRVVVNVPAKTYNVYVRVQDDSEFRLATNYAFRTEQNTVASLAFWNLWSDVGTTLNLCGLRLSPTFLSADAGNDVTVSPGGSTALSALANGGQGPYSFRWSPATGLSNANIANPIATPTATTTYTLTVTDVWGALAVDTVTVTVRTATLGASAGADREILAGGSTQLTGAASGGTAPYSFKWSPAAGLNNANVAAPMASPSATTTYILTVTDSLGATATDSVIISIRPSGLLVNAGADKEINLGGSTQLSGTVTGGAFPYTYRWTPTTALSNANVAAPMAAPSVTTTYVLTVTDSNGATGTDSVTISIRSATLIVNAGPDKSISSGGSTQLSGSATGGTAPYSYRWTPTTGLNNPNIASPTASPSVTTSYTLTVTDNSGSTATDRAIVSVAAQTPTNAFVVARNAPNASDGNPGTEALPWKTLAKAGSAARAGQTVLIKAGTYNETLSPAASGTPGNLITFKAYPGDECKGSFAGIKSDCRVIIDGQNVRDSGINAYPRKYVRFEGFEIRNHGDDAVYLHGYYDNTAEGLEVVNNYIHHNGNDAITFRGDFARNILIENNEITENPQTAISSGGGSGHVIRGNNIHYNGKDGIRGGGSNLLIEFNRIYDQFHTDLHQDGMDLGDTSDSIIRYNTIYDLTQLIYFHDFDNGGGFSNLEIYGNVFYTDRYMSVSGGETSGIFFDARFHDSPVRNIKIHSNTFAWTGYDGIWVYGGVQTNITVRNNIFFDSGMDADGALNSDYNVFYNSAKPSFEGSHSVTANPKFVNYTRHQAWDFRLQAGSPAVDRGDPSTLSIMNLSTDFKDIDNNRRPQGTACDAGAFERPQ